MAEDNDNKITDAEETTETNGNQKKTRVRSPYLFPAYGLDMALQVAERVEMDGGGSLSEAALAVAMSSSAKSSTFRLKTLTAKQFGIVVKSGPNLVTTPLGKAIFKPTHEMEKANALREAFLKVPLFSEVASRYNGTPLPESHSLRNILERELGIVADRVVSAERVLMDSAREADILKASGGNTYLIADGAIDTTHEVATSIPQNGGQQSEFQATPSSFTPEPSVPPGRPQRTNQAAGQFTLSEEDLALLSDEEFKTFWEGLGHIARRRGKRSLEELDG